MIVKQDQDEIAGFLGDASNMPGGSADRVCIVESADEVAELLAACSRDRTPVTVAGAGTGLSGGRVPMGGTVVATARLNRILSIDAERKQAVVEPGVMLSELQSEVERLDLLYPPDPTERTCSIGGTIATNASGARTFKYGATRAYVDALDVVLATGERLELVRGQQRAAGRNLQLRTVDGRAIDLVLPSYTMPAIKHAAGYFAAPEMDAIDLFIGSEGTLGVVTRATLRLIAMPERIVSGVVFFADERATIAFVESARTRSVATREGADGIDARALEFIDAAALVFIRDRYPAIPEGASGGAVWFEQEVTDETEEALLAEWYELMQAHGALVDDSWFAISLEDQRRIREFRHAVPSAVYEYISEHRVAKIGTDMAVPDGRLEELLAFYRSEFARAGLKNVTWGHIGNNHLHANVLADGDEEYRRGRELYGRFIEKALELGGTVSAEHGIGKIKKAYLEKMFGADGIESMRAIKRRLDPAWILGAGTMFD
jgi:D-lactate dehydrogenase (cytochrome)